MTGIIMTSSPVSERRNYDLPNELLYEIFDYLDDGRPRWFPPTRRRLHVYENLLRVCRRWRLVVREYIWRSIAHRSVDGFINSWGAERHTAARFVKHLRVGPGELPPAVPLHWYESYKLRDLVTGPDDFPFPNLRVLVNTTSISSTSFIHTLSVACPRLEKLVLYWNSRDDEFPKTEMLPHLQTLLIYTIWAWRTPPGRPISPHLQPEPSSNLTSLYLSNPLDTEGEGEGVDFISKCCDVHFPRLRVLRLVSIHVVSKVFDFIHRHPSIIEVALHLDRTRTGDHYFRLEPLIRLIRDNEYDMAVDVPTSPLLETAGNAVYPPRFDMTYGIFWQVAFTRAPLSPADTRYTGRYKCTGVALYLQDPPTEGWAGYTDYVELRDMIQFVGDISTKPELSVFRDVEELRLGSEVFDNSNMNLDDIMSYLTGGLRLLPLRKFALWLPKYRSFTFSETHSTGFPEIWDRSLECSLHPPSEFAYEPEIIGELGPLELDHYGPDIRRALDIGPDVPWTEVEDYSLIPVWEFHNQTAMEGIVGRLARSCCHLERFEWWALEGHTSEYFTMIWDWKIQRYGQASAQGPGRTKALSGRLLGPHRPDGFWGRFPVLVGEGMEKHRDLGYNRPSAY